MGLFPSSEFKGAHILHYTKFCENKLFVYLPDQDVLYTFSIFNKGRKYKFYAQRTISTPSGCIFLIGGQSIQVHPDEEDLLLVCNDVRSSLSISNFVANINLEKHKNFKIDINDMPPCEPLPEARSLHGLIYCDPYIYVLGGEVAPSGSTRSCLKLHTQTRKWEKISDINFSSRLIEPTGIALSNSLYIFDTAEKSNTPRVHRYSIEFDQWMEIIYRRNKDLVIPPTLNSSVYQISEKELLIVGGTRVDKEDRDKREFWYIFDSLTEEIRDLNYYEGKGQIRRETQGNVDYSFGNTVYGRLGERNVKFFNKNIKVWEELRVIPENILDNNTFGCCSARGLKKAR